MIALGFGLSLAATATSLVPVYVQRPIIDNILAPFQQTGARHFDRLPLYLSAMAAAAILTFLLAWSRNYVLAWVSERVAADLRNATYTHLQRLSLEFFGGKRTGDLIARVSSDTEKINIFLSVHLLDFANDVLMIGMTAVIMLGIDMRLAVVTLCPLPLIAWLVQRARRRLRGGFQLGSRAWSEMTSVLADSIPGIRVVKAFAQEQREIDRFHRSNDRVLSAADRVNRTWAFFSPVVQVLNEFGLLIIWVYAVWRIAGGDVKLTVGALWVFVQYARGFYGRLETMSRIVSAVQRAAAATQRVFGILDRQATVPEPLHPVHPVALKGQIELRDVAFRYGNRTVVDGINLVIRPGEMLGLVGASGSGKTTLVNLVCRFYDVAEGAVLIDGTDVRAFPIEEYRRHIGLVLQEPFLFYGTIAENIAYGRPAARLEDIVAAARAARAHEFILRLPDGYDSLVGERGQTLSGGERQRISIARAILINPRLLILDEATSSVDTETEREIQLALENLIRGRTTIAIAHRLSTLARADRLAVLDRGRIIEIGRHDELLRAGRTYARLYHAQSAMAKERTRIERPGPDRQTRLHPPARSLGAVGARRRRRPPLCRRHADAGLPPLRRRPLDLDLRRLRTRDGLPPGLERGDARGAGDPRGGIVPPGTHSRDPPHHRGNHGRTVAMGSGDGPRPQHLPDQQRGRRPPSGAAPGLDPRFARRALPDSGRSGAGCGQPPHPRSFPLSRGRRNGMPRRRTR